MTEQPSPSEQGLNPLAEQQTDRRHVQTGDLAMLFTSDYKRYVLHMHPEGVTHTHLGIYRHSALIGQPWGAAVQSQIGHAALLLQPSLTDLMKSLKRGTQIIYPKDAAYIVHRLSLHAGSRVIEAGTGSGGLTTALAWAVMPTGLVYTHEVRPDIYQVARENLARIALLPYVKMMLADIEEGFKANDVDAVFLDVREPWRYLSHVRAALRPGGFFASLLPTANQVIELLRGFDQHHFADVSVEELILRPYKASPNRFRPDDNLIGHTGYLIFARCIDPGEDMGRWQRPERQRYEARLRTEAEIAAEAQRRAIEIAAGGKKYPEMPLPD
ncbi:MAG: tRNA (adenine-N1)-methyltransferase [Caldilinea sp.]|uniref:tRNA (adenine-N1)-methyltransferase n=1 Tax=Caldilinea sp. TaxID=2293560 RepID=UPI002BCC5E10|nr:tRNA (adenine-N1)-methyltransferase [Caldilinea sp.]HRA65012.1 tRNA (adenine-N1)-methyltransferase [Caldilinea sp.]